MDHTAQERQELDELIHELEELTVQTKNVLDDYKDSVQKIMTKTETELIGVENNISALMAQ
ncbi:MAG: hypothetical protein K0S20_643 [Patescibacteria group bacterium]|jgi:hypothetical protein|nr:hypothetical protein [Patescibacteria group bacterium]